MDVAISIVFLECLAIFAWEAVIKTILKGFGRKRIDKILKVHPEIHRDISLIDQVLEIDDFKGKYMLHINNEESPILLCNTEDEAREISSLWYKYIGKINDEIIHLELERRGLL